MADAHSWAEASKRELEQLRAVGDTLQSEASRLAEWAAGIADGGSPPSKGANVPYEVRGAIYEIERAVEQWTMIRSGSKVTGPPTRERLPQPPKPAHLESLGAEAIPPEHRMVKRHTPGLLVATITYSDGTKSTLRHAPGEDVDKLAERVAPLGATVKQVDRKPGPCPHDKPAYQWCDICHG